MAYLRAGRTADAVVQLEQAAALGGGDAAVTLGAVYFATGENDKASALFDKALALLDRIVTQRPDTPEAAQAAAFIKELRKGVFDERGFP